MWIDAVEKATRRAERRRLGVGLGLGAASGAAIVAGGLGAIPDLVAAAAVLLALIGARLLWSSTGPADDAISFDQASRPGNDDVRQVQLGTTARLTVDRTTILAERLFAVTAERLEDLAWAYSVHHPRRRWIPFLPDAAIVLKFAAGSEIVLPCFNRQVTTALSAIRHFAGHAALGWAPELAESWAERREEFVASVRARLGHVSGGDR